MTYKVMVFWVAPVVDAAPPKVTRYSPIGTFTALFDTVNVPPVLCVVCEIGIIVLVKTLSVAVFSACTV